uniref:mRNA decay activator protein ZFP36 n=1 Tax=Gouania willdenowi TaxID=441366 RepID=A0A8C5DU10_GOUWI
SCDAFLKDLCSIFISLVLGFQRRHSLCPVTLPNSKFNSGASLEEEAESCGWGLSGSALDQAWSGRLPRSSLSHIPFRVDRSVSMIEACSLKTPPPLQPPPGFSLSDAAASRAPLPHISTRYKTELCRTFEENGTCKYGTKCQFAHGVEELRGLSRHPKYKTEPCRTFHTIGFCPYGARCHFIHNADELQVGGSTPAPPQKPRPPLLRHSLSFAGFSSSRHNFKPVEESLPPLAAVFARAASVSPPPSSSGSPELLSPLFPEPGALKHCRYRLSGLTGLADAADSALRFYAVSESLVPPPAKLQRCFSADSLSEEGYASSCSLSSSSSSGADSPGLENRRLPIFSSLSVTDQ